MTNLNLIPTAEVVKKIREDNECSIFEAKSIVQKKLLLDAINSATNIDDLKSILTCLVNNVRIN